MQPGVTPGAILELHAARAAGGTAPGSNDPLTTQWADTSGNGNHGTLTGFVTETDTGYTVTFEPTRAQTTALTVTRQTYELEATLADGDVVTLVRGTLAVVRDIPAK